MLMGGTSGKPGARPGGRSPCPWSRITECLPWTCPRPREMVAGWWGWAASLGQAWRVAGSRGGGCAPVCLASSCPPLRLQPLLTRDLCTELTRILPPPVVTLSPLDSASREGEGLGQLLSGSALTPGPRWQTPPTLISFDRVPRGTRGSSVNSAPGHPPDPAPQPEPSLGPPADQPRRCLPLSEAVLG